MNPCQPQYPSGAASLFAVMTRTVIITCPHCLSENTELVDHEHDIHRAVQVILFQDRCAEGDAENQDAVKERGEKCGGGQAVARGGG